MFCTARFQGPVSFPAADYLRVASPGAIVAACLLAVPPLANRDSAFGGSA